MGHDIVIKAEGGEVVDQIFRLCSGNWSDEWERYGISPYMFHGHSSRTVLKICNDAIEKLLLEGIKVPGNIEDECEINSNFLWGWHDKDRPVVETQNEELALVYTKKRLGAFLYLCTVYRDYAMEYFKPSDEGWYRWYSDQAYKVIPYKNDHGYESQGEEDN